MPRLAVIGHPVAHSRSPAMQSAALAALGLGGEWSYEAIDVAAEGFEALVREIAAQGFAGANVTVPHKRAALALADEATAAAREIGAANTFSFQEDQTAEEDASARAWIAADNTDAPGLLAALPATPRGRRALVLGAGGASRAAVWALAGEGAEVDVWNRTASRAEVLVTELGGRAVEDPNQGEYALIVNTTAVGLSGEEPFEHLPLSPGCFDAAQVIVDMVYGARPSPILAAAEVAGAVTVDGLEILAQQGALSLRAWTGREAPLEVMRAAARA